MEIFSRFELEDPMYIFFLILIIFNEYSLALDTVNDMTGASAIKIRSHVFLQIKKRGP